jgi:hypothetical protein
MIFEQSTQNAIWHRRNEFHCLTFAEEGFAPLNIWTGEIGLTKGELIAFANSVNQRDEPGSLYPRVPVSAVPRRLIRDQSNSEMLCLSIEDFLRVNALTIRSLKLVLDFRTPKIAPFVEIAIDLSLRSPDISFINELIVLKG